MSVIWKTIKYILIGIGITLLLCVITPIALIVANVKKTILPFMLFLIGLCFPILYIIINWSFLIERDPFTIAMAFVPLVYWKLLDLFKVKTIPLIAVLAMYFVAFITLLTVYLSPNI